MTHSLSSLGMEGETETERERERERKRKREEEKEGEKYFVRHSCMLAKAKYNVLTVLLIDCNKAFDFYYLQWSVPPPPLSLSLSLSLFVLSFSLFMYVVWVR